MPYPMPNGALMEVTVRYELVGQTLLNVGHWRWNHDSDSADGPTIINDFLTKFDAEVGGVSTRLAAFATEEVSIIRIVAQMIRPTRFARIEIDPQVNQGTETPPSAPPNWVAAAVKRTEAAGPHAHGSMFMSGFPAEAIAANRIAVGSITAMDLYLQKWAATYPGPLGDGSWSPVIYNRTAPALSNVITSATMITEPRSHRRRQLRVGI